MLNACRHFSLIRSGVLLIAALLLASQAQAERVVIPSPPQLAAEAYLLVDANTGEILVEHNADKALPPASLTKMMTSYVVSEEIAQDNISEEDMVNISVEAWQMGGSKMFVREGTRVSVKDLLRGVIIQSGNDASVALAEHVAGSEEGFVEIMNQRAADLGMTGTQYQNATGWPAEGHVTTARDLGTLARALIRDHPRHYKMYAEKYFKYNGINQPNRNKLLFRNPDVDGIKTGHTEEAGYGLVSSAVQEGMRLVAVVMGTRSEDSRAAESQKLLTYGYRHYRTHQLYSPDDEVGSSRVWAGRSEDLSLGVAEDIFLTVPRGAQEDLEATLHVDEVIKAPIQAGDTLGNVTVVLDDEQLLDVPVVARESVQQAGLLGRLWDHFKLFFINLFGLAQGGPDSAS